MSEIFYILAKTVEIFFSIIYIAMIVRMLFPLFSPDPDGSPIFRLCLVVTEVVIAPARLILGIFGIGQNSPIDFSFLGGYFLLLIIQMFLPALP